MRVAALQLMAAVVAGVGDGDRNTAAVQADALKAVLRVAKEGPDADTCMALAGGRAVSARTNVGICLGPLTPSEVLGSAVQGMPQGISKCLQTLVLAGNARVAADLHPT